MKRIFAMLTLTRREQRVVVAIVLIAMLIAAVVHHQMVTEKQIYPQLRTMDRKAP